MGSLHLANSNIAGLAETGTQATREALEAQCYRVKLCDTGKFSTQRFDCYLKRGNSARGYFGATKEAAIEKAATAILEGDKIGW